jgi:excinuclease ABC subunit C
VYALQKALELSAPPAHIEGFDISNIQGAQPVASMVVFRNGQAARGSYRRFRMRHPEGPNDFAMMAEVVARRAARIVAGEFPVPDLIMVDGGKGQVGAAATALEQEGLGSVPLVGLAKREEELFLPGVGEPLRLPRSHEGLKLLIRVRDEAHRFAVTFHRQVRGRETLASELDDIVGVGRHRKVLLLQAFGSLEAIRGAELEDLSGVPGIGVKVARQIHEALHATQGEVSKSGAA